MGIYIHIKLKYMEITPASKGEKQNSKRKKYL